MLSISGNKKEKERNIKVINGNITLEKCIRILEVSKLTLLKKPYIYIDFFYMVFFLIYFRPKRHHNFLIIYVPIIMDYLPT